MMQYLYDLVYGNLFDIITQGSLALFLFFGSITWMVQKIKKVASTWNAND